MIRSAVALVFLATPVIAAPAHRQPTPTAVQPQSINPAPPANTDAKTQAAQTEQDRIKMQKELDERQQALDAKVNRSMGTICKGC